MILIVQIVSRAIKPDAADDSLIVLQILFFVLPLWVLILRIPAQFS